jgi:hypothetical protein
MLDSQIFINLKKGPKLKRKTYFIDSKIKNNKKNFTHSKEKVIKRGKIKCPSPSHVLG